MTVIVDLNPEVVAQAEKNAVVRGMTLVAYLENLVKEVVLPQPLVTNSQTQLEKNQEMLARIRQRRQDNATNDPEELARRQADWEEFKKGMNEAHTSNRIIYP